MICLFVLPWCVCLVRHGFYGLLVGLFCLCVCSVLRFGYATKRGDRYHPEHPGAPPSTPEYPRVPRTCADDEDDGDEKTALRRRSEVPSGSTAKWEYG